MAQVVTSLVDDVTVTTCHSKAPGDFQLQSFYRSQTWYGKKNELGRAAVTVQTRGGLVHIGPFQVVPTQLQSSPKSCGKKMVSVLTIWGTKWPLSDISTCAGFPVIVQEATLRRLIGSDHDHFAS